MIFLIEPPLSPSYKKEAVRYLIDNIPVATLEEIATIIKSERSDWEVHHQYDIGITVRNLLREGGFPWDAVELDDVWAGLVEKAVKKKIR
jgi:hypothetical protein